MKGYSPWKKGFEFAFDSLEDTRITLVEGS